MGAPLRIRAEGEVRGTSQQECVMSICLSPARTAAWLAGAAGMLFLAAPALAQDYGPPPQDAYASGPPEEVIVQAPRLRFRAERNGPRSLDLPPEKLSLSTAVRYDDLDLASWQGARELRFRVHAAAHHVCGQLADAFPVYQLNGTRCYRDALQNGLVRADEAIATARQSYYYGFED
jgi:UrcA family protein